MISRNTILRKHHCLHLYYLLLCNQVSSQLRILCTIALTNLLSLRQSCMTNFEKYIFIDTSGSVRVWQHKRQNTFSLLFSFKIVCHNCTQTKEVLNVHVTIFWHPMNIVLVFQVEKLNQILHFQNHVKQVITWLHIANDIFSTFLQS